MDVTRTLYLFKLERIYPRENNIWKNKWLTAIRNSLTTCFLWKNKIFQNSHHCQFEIISSYSCQSWALGVGLMKTSNTTMVRHKSPYSPVMSCCWLMCFFSSWSYLLYVWMQLVTHNKEVLLVAGDLIIVQTICFQLTNIVCTTNTVFECCC